MSEVAEAFERYCSAIEAIGATIHRHLAPPAPPEEIDRLESVVGATLPTEVRDWFGIANGLNYDHPETTSWRSAYLFPPVWPRSVQECVDWLHEWSGVIDVQPFPYTPRQFVPLLSGQSRWDSVLLVDCAAANVSTFALENYDSDAGYYHRSLVDFIDGNSHNAESGFLAVDDGGITIDEDLFPMSARNYDRRWQAGFGFDPDGPPPPRIEPRDV